MIEEFENRKRTKNELNNKPISKKKKEFNLKDFNKEYEEFIKKLKENSQNETV